jgi:hypothetical protein
MTRLGSDLDQRFQNKAPLMHGRMRNLQARLIHYKIAEQNDVYINLARALVAHAETSHRPFDVQRQLEKLSRRFPSFDGRDAVQKPRLVGDLYRLGFIERRDCEQVTGLFKMRQGFSQVGGTISNVRSQRQISDFLHTASFAAKGVRSQQKLTEDMGGTRSDW